jgi:hypothetical protein
MMISLCHMVRGRGGTSEVRMMIADDIEIA